MPTSSAKSPVKPVATSKPVVAPVPPKAKAKAKPQEVKERVYESVEVCGIPIPREALKFTDAMATFFLGWETEEDAIARAVKADPKLGLKADGLKFGEDFLLRDEFNQKVRCSRNITNREFRDKGCRAIAQSILRKEFLFNGETIIIGEYGAGISLQHRCIALKLAVQMWKRDGYWQKYWGKEEPYIETLVVTGVPEDQQTIQTLDTGSPRTLADAYATSGMFDSWGLPDKDGNLIPLSRPERGKASKLLDRATDLLWKRTGAALDEHQKYQTHVASAEFLARHPKLIDASKHLYEEDQGLAISMLGLSRGDCAALCYLMGCSASEREKYDETKDETNLDWSRWEKAMEFWTLLAPPEKERSAFAKTITAVIFQVGDGRFGGLETRDKMYAVVVNAWNQWIGGGKVTEANIAPLIKLNDNNEKVLDVDQLPKLEGIDLGAKPEPEEKEQTAEEIQAAKDERAKTLAEKAQAGKKGKPGTAATPTNIVKEAVEGVKAKYPDSIILFSTADGGHTVWKEDAVAVSEARGAKYTTKNEMEYLKIAPGTDLPTLAGLLRVKTGKKILVADDQGEKITDITPVAKPVAAKPVVAPKPAPVVVPPVANGPKKLLKNPFGPTLKGGTGK